MLRGVLMDQPIDSVVFSRESGVVWASWYDNRASVRLGDEEHVADMMADFLAQLELGKRLMNPED